MSKPLHLPDARTLAEVSDVTWPAASTQAHGAWMIREGQGGGSRVSAATEAWPVTDADLPLAEAAMRGLGQKPLFQIREGEERLDALLEAHGYVVRDPVNLYACAAAELAAAEIPPGAAFTMWPPLELLRDIWAEGEIGAARQAVMERASCPKAAVLVRSGDYAGGVGFVGCHKGIAMVHALFVRASVRRQGAGRLVMQAAARWALEQGAEVLSLMVTKGNHEANPFYADLGFTRVGQYHYRVHPEG